jgi:hypothetical protein
MKNTVVFFIAAMAVFGASSTQRAEAQSTNIAQKIIGTWVDQHGVTWVFSANGTLTQTYRSDITEEYKYIITDTMLAYQSFNGYVWVYRFSITSDGKTLIIPINDSVHNTDTGFWLTKK